MEHPDIDAWLTGLKDRRNLEKLEVKAAEAWYETLSPVQREVFDELLQSFHGISHLRRIHCEGQEDEE
jgi:hypothetical protein